jgi:hypothetical protein
VEKSSKFLPEIIILVSSANEMGSVKVFIVGGRSFIYIMKSKGPKFNPWEIPCSIVAHFQENSLCDFISFFVFSLSDRI